MQGEPSTYITMLEGGGQWQLLVVSARPNLRKNFGSAQGANEVQPMQVAQANFMDWMFVSPQNSYTKALIPYMIML